MIRRLGLLLAVMAACSPKPEPAPEPAPPPISKIMETELSELRTFQERQLACLARTAYFEARGEGQQGMTAVIFVVLNRTRNPGYPDEPCAVIEEGQDGRCQFSWMCDGKSDTPKNRQAYRKALAIAQAAAAGEVPDPTDGANMFHAKQVTPYWTSAAQQTAEIGSHVFYRLDE